MTGSDRAMGLLRGGVPLTLLVDLARVSQLAEGVLLEAPSGDMLLGDDCSLAAAFDLEMAV